MAEIIDEKTASDSLPRVLSSLLSSPDMLTKIGDIISKYSSSESKQIRDSSTPIRDIPDNNGFIEENEGTSPTLSSAANGDDPNISALLPSLLGAIGKGGTDSITAGANKEQTALLLAIRPYLSENRRELVDTFLKMNKIGEILKNFA